MKRLIESLTKASKTIENEANQGNGEEVLKLVEDDALKDLKAEFSKVRRGAHEIPTDFRLRNSPPFLTPPRFSVAVR